MSSIDDIRNDDSVEVGLYANADPIELSPTREPLANATYAIEQDPRYQAKTRGRLKNGVLTTDPVDVRVHWVVNSIYLDRPLRDAQLQMTLSEDGVLEGYLAGYSPIGELYDFQYGFRNGKNSKGQPAEARLIMISSNGQAAVLGHTCNGAYYAIRELARRTSRSPDRRLHVAFHAVSDQGDPRFRGRCEDQERQRRPGTPLNQLRTTKSEHVNAR